jgi:hypothetical protein
MNVADRRRALNVAATHAAKQAIELVESVAKIGERLRDDPRIGSEVDALWAKGNIHAIRRELADLEHLLAGHEPPVPVAPETAQAQVRQMLQASVEAERA